MKIAKTIYQDVVYSPPKFRKIYDEATTPGSIPGIGAVIQFLDVGELRGWIVEQSQFTEQPDGTFIAILGVRPLPKAK